MIHKKVKTSLILLAGGKGLRMGLERPKQFLKLGSKMIAQRALNCFTNDTLFDEYVIVCAKAYRPLFDLDPSLKVTFASPGVKRQDSLLNGLLALSLEDSLVFVHDAARPFFDPKYSEMLAQSAHQYGSAILGVPSTSTIKRVGKNHCVEETLNRNEIWEAQTPQVAFKKDLIQGLEKAKQEEVVLTDESSILEFLDKKVKMVQGDALNFKITRPEDLELAKAIVTHNEFDEKTLQTAYSL